MTSVGCECPPVAVADRAPPVPGRRARSMARLPLRARLCVLPPRRGEPPGMRGGNMRPIAVSRIALMPVARTFSAIASKWRLGRLGKRRHRVRHHQATDAAAVPDRQLQRHEGAKPIAEDVDGRRQRKRVHHAERRGLRARLPKLNSTGSDAPKPGRLRQVTRWVRASGGSTSSNTLISVSNECRSNQIGTVAGLSVFGSHAVDSDRRHVVRVREYDPV